MRSIFLAALLSLALVASAWSQCQIASALTTNNGLAGNTFDVMNNLGAPVPLNSMSVNIDAGTFTVEVWACTGSAATILNTQALWTQVGLFAGVVGAGLNVFTTLPAFTTPILIPAGGTVGIYCFTQAGSAVNYTSGTAAGASFITDGALTIFEGWGMSANFGGTPISGRIPSVAFAYGPPPITEFQVNTARASLSVNNAIASGCSAALVNQSVFTCLPLQPVTGTISFTSVNVNLPWDIVVSSGTAVGASSGGITLPGPQFVNVNVGLPLIFVNGFLASNLPGFGLPGLTSTTLNYNYSITAQTDVTLQGVIVDPTQLAGIALTLATEYHANITPAPVSVSGPILDNAVTTVNVVNPPACWTGGIPFYGTLYSQMFVSSNGRVLFVGTDTDLTATIAEGLTDNPFVGYWTDLNPALGGSITVSNPGPGVVRVNYANVPYAAEAATANSFGIEFDTNSGIVSIDGLGGIAVNPQTVLGTGDAAFLGITRGNTGATNGLGPQLFSNGGSGSALNATDMWFDFYLQVAAGAGRVASLGAGTLNSIAFVPSGTFSPNYNWIGG